MSRLQGFCLCLLAFLKPSACLASSCADRPRPCVEVSGGNAQVSLQAGNFHSSVLNYGSFSGRALSLLQHGQCLQIMAIGGSVTCGHCLDRNSTQLPSERTAWPSALANLLNNELPCHNSSGMLSNHVVTNVCAGGWSTALWLERISASLRSNEDLHAALTTADVIIVETAVNDIEELRRHDMRASARDQPLPVLIMRATELLVNILLTLDNKPSIVYLGASSRALWGGGPRHSGDAILDQLEVVRLYNIPYVSAIEGLGPFTTAVGRSWFLDVYRCDLCCHPGVLGHNIIATLVAQLLFMHRDNAYRDILPNFTDTFHGLYDYLPHNLTYTNQRDVDMYTKTVPLYLAMDDKSAQSRVRLAEGWALASDVPGKRVGLYTNGSTSSPKGPALVLFSRNDSLAHLKIGRIHVALLSSYTGMGVATVSVYHASTGDASASRPILGAASHDCLWETHASEDVIVEIHLNDSWHDLVWTDGSSLVVEFDYERTSPARESNKVKLSSIALF